jgi:hypothetical protein
VGYRYVWLFLVFCTVVGTSLMSGKILKELQPTRETGSLIALTTRHAGYQSISTNEDVA